MTKRVALGRPCDVSSLRIVFVFKGLVPRDFRLQVFFMNQFPQAPDYPVRADSNLFENSRRYAQLKVYHPVANGKNLYYYLE